VVIYVSHVTSYRRFILYPLIQFDQELSIFFRFLGHLYIETNQPPTKDLLHPHLRSPLLPLLDYETLTRALSGRPQRDQSSNHHRDHLKSLQHPLYRQCGRSFHREHTLVNSTHSGSLASLQPLLVRETSVPDSSAVCWSSL
jgi:hypothetical protein